MNPPIPTAKIRYFESTPLKPPPLFGVFLRWPEDGEDWIHPFDVGVARHLLPGDRIFRRQNWNGQYYEFVYAKLKFRARPRMWLVVEHEGLDIGDKVELKSKMGKNWPMIATITEIRWNAHQRQIQYFIAGVNRKVDRPFLANDLQIVHAITNSSGKIPARHPPLNSVASYTMK